MRMYSTTSDPLFTLLCDKHIQRENREKIKNWVDHFFWQHFSSWSYSNKCLSWPANSTQNIAFEIKILDYRLKIVELKVKLNFLQSQSHYLKFRDHLFDCTCVRPESCTKSPRHLALEMKCSWYNCCNQYWFEYGKETFNDLLVPTLTSSLSLSLSKPLKSLTSESAPLWSDTT